MNYYLYILKGIQYVVDSYGVMNYIFKHLENNGVRPNKSRNISGHEAVFQKILGSFIHMFYTYG